MTEQGWRITACLCGATDAEGSRVKMGLNPFIKASLIMLDSHYEGVVSLNLTSTILFLYLCTQALYLFSLPPALFSNVIAYLPLYKVILHYLHSIYISKLVPHDTMRMQNEISSDESRENIGLYKYYKQQHFAAGNEGNIHW